mgnify:CR=1 FL=1
MTTGFCFHHIKLKVKHERGIVMEITGLIRRFINTHKSACEDWQEGEPVKAWKDEDGFVCVKYESGNWWHYNETRSGLEWW